LGYILAEKSNNTTEIDNLDDLDIVPFREKFAYGLAQFPGTFYGGVMGVIQSFYYAWMGLQYGWIIIAQIVYAIWNMVNDPIFGTKIGNTRYYNKKKREIQRYLPYIKYGAPLFSLCFAIVFFPPDAWRGNSDATVQVWLFVWYLVTQLAYDTLFTLVLCCHVSLPPQMTLNQKERENIQLICTIFSVPAIVLGFLVPTIFLKDPNVESIAVFQIMVIIVAILGVIPFWLCAHYVNENSEYIPDEKTGVIESLKLAFKNPSYIIYVIYDGVSVFILNMLIVTLPFYLTWFLEPLEGYDLLTFWIVPLLCLLISIKIVLYISNKFSTKAALTYSLALLTIGFFVSFLAGLTRNWIFVSIGFSIVMLGFPGDFILHNPMRADTIDYDYWKVSGERREGVYAGVGPILSKPMISVALAVPTALMSMFGLIYVEQAEGLAATQGLEMAALGLNISMALIPAITALIGLIIWVKFYPLTGDVVKEMKKELYEMQMQKRKEYKEQQRN